MQSKCTPRISVIIPTYNRSQIVKRAIESVINQTAYPAEIIVVDDGSTDETHAMAEGYKGRINYVYQSNAGVSVARNTGIDIATGEWIAFLDSDDEWVADKLEAQLRLIDQFPDCSWHSGKHWPDPELNDIKRVRDEFRELDFFDPIQNSYLCHTSSTLVKKSVFEKTGGFNPELRFGQHMEMWFRIAARFPRLGYDENVICAAHTASIHSNSNTLDRNQMLLTFESLRNLQSIVDSSTMDQINLWIRNAASIQYFKVLQRRDPPTLVPDFDQLASPVWIRISEIVGMLPGPLRIRTSRLISDYLRKGVI